jgi:UTP pyrophosphatase
MSTSKLTYLSHYSEDLQKQVRGLIDQKKLSELILNKYPKSHNIKTDKALYDFTINLKNKYMRKAAPLSKVLYDNKLTLKKQALGLHSFVSRVQGKKLKAKNEIRLAAVLKNGPLEFLRVIVVHELAHLKEKEHNKAFYKMCLHMECDYHQLEFDLRLYLTQVDLFGELYS